MSILDDKQARWHQALNQLQEKGTHMTASTQETPEQHTGEVPRGTVIRASDAAARLKIKRQAFYSHVQNGTFQAYAWDDTFTHLIPLAPGAIDPKNLKVFYLEDIERYARLHPVIGTGALHDLTEDEEEMVIEDAEQQLADLGYVSHNRLRIRMSHEGLRATESLPGIMQLIDENEWPLAPNEQEEIDELIKEGERLKAKHGYVTRSDLIKFMKQFKKSSPYYPVIRHVANREGWPMPPNTESYAQQRRAGRVYRHKPRQRRDTSSNEA
ncbi:MAG TPA: hypothetical protein VHL10_05215 [Nitrososphaera sp.]|nr:hypothetical protein [Nitrososphaera sp.]